MAWIVKWSDSSVSEPFATEWEAERHACLTDLRRRWGGFRLIDQDSPAGVIHALLDPNLAGAYWRRVAGYLGARCDRFWIHWWFRPHIDHRSPFEQLMDPAGAPPAEPLPDRSELGLGRLAPVIDTIEPSWICPNGAAASGPLSPETLALLLAQAEVRWFDLHLYSGGRRLFTATDGGTEHFAWVSEQDLKDLAAEGIPRKLFRSMAIPAGGE